MTDFETEFLAAYGKLSVKFAFTEELMKQFINFLLDPKDSKVGSCITADMPFNPLYHALMSLYRLKENNEDLVNIFSKLLDDIKKIEEKRNKFIHSIWRINSSSNTAIRFKRTAKFSVGLNRDDKEYDISEINKDIESLEELYVVLGIKLENWETKYFQTDHL